MTAIAQLNRFREVVDRPEREIDLAQAALQIASDEYPDLDIPHYLQVLDDMADQARSFVPQQADPLGRLGALNRYLFDKLHFRGNQEDYYDPRNSYLNDVIDRRVGLPITLSVVYMEVGRRLRLPLYGVGLPGHFIVKWQDEADEIFVDPFHEGEILDEPAMMGLVEQTYHVRVRLQPEWTRPVGPHHILTRMLNNLRAIFLHQQNFERALQVLEKLLVLQPDSEENLRDAGLLAYRLGYYRQAAQVLEEYLLHYPNARESVHVRSYLSTVWVAITRLN